VRRPPVRTHSILNVVLLSGERRTKTDVNAVSYPLGARGELPHKKDEDAPRNILKRALRWH